MELKDLKLKTVAYYMQTFVITAAGVSFEVPRTMIVNVDIDKQYENMIYPMFYVSVNVPNWFYTQITKNVDNITVSMNLQYRLADTNERMTSPTGSMTTELAGNFKAVVPYTTQIGDSTVQRSVEKAAATYKKNYTYNEYAIVELALYNTNAHAASFNTLNAVLSSANTTDALTYCLNQCGINNVLLSKSDNTTTYSEFKILPESGMKNIFRIIEDYNFHNSGSIVFFDLVDSYIVAKKVGCYAWKNNEFKSTHFLSLSEYSNNLGRFSGVYVNAKEKYNVACIQKTAYTTQRLDGSPLLKNSGEVEYLSIITEQCLMSMLTPNKEVIVNIDSPDAAKYNGKYRIRSMSVNMVPQGEFLNPTFNISLRR